ncbi:MAG TPA: hypothetical protein VMB21_00945 [Candidatus Limnocylindria bacterium]|nr:hypothetical protein [Candidatus Limnocylindria bacterium]
MPSDSSLRPRISGLAWAAIAVLGVLLVLFGALLSPGEVLFANDGPLGLLKNHESDGVGNFLSVWLPSNWLGGTQPAAVPTLSHVLFMVVNAVLFAKLQAPLSLLLLGVSAAFFCHKAGFSPWIGVLTALAAALNSNPFSYACWGLPGKAFALAMTLVALGLLLDESAGWRRLIRVMLAGFAVGIVVMEGADVGAILSLYVAAFALWQTLVAGGFRAAELAKGGLRLLLVSVCAAWLATHALSTLIGTQIIGVKESAQKAESQEQRWEFATGWSFPKAETLRIVVPGLYGYRMDSPDGGAYWGAVGPGGTPESRFSGDGQYAGIGVVLIAAFAVASSFRRDKSPFSARERKYVWFWAVVAVGSLLLAYGKFFEPLYRLVFALPYFSTIRIPMKFLHGMDLALWILFAYGLEALARTGLAKDRTARAGLGDQIRAWRKAAPVFERRWVNGSLIVLGLTVLVAVLYTSRAQQLTRYLGTLFPAGTPNPATAEFSIREVWLAIAFLATTVATVALAIAGCFGGAKARRAWVLLGIILVVDLVRANQPWVIHYDYQMRYQTDAVLDVLRQQPYEHRVSAHLSPRRAAPLVPANDFVYLQKEWLENQFQYFNIQSLDIDQMPRTPELDAAYMGALDLAMGNPAAFEKLSIALSYASVVDQLQPQAATQVRDAISVAKAAGPILGRLWQLTNTRYLIAAPKTAESLNDFVDPARRRFRVVLPFTLGLKPGAPQPTDKSGLADVVQLLKATPNDQGSLALIEFAGALPRAKFYTTWQTTTNDAVALDRLRSSEFDPEKSVLLAEEPAGLKPAPEAAPGEATIASYQPKDIVLKTKSAAAGVLLLNDRWHPDWQVTVDGQPSALLRANFIMRGVAVPAGEHTVEYRFNPPHGTLWVSLSAIVACLGCIGLLAFGPKQKPATA